MPSSVEAKTRVTDLILHHFDLSPFAEKIRKVFGIKGLPWQSVQIPMIMPKPNLMTLTGGYRKTPVLQIGADVYCDTALIVDVLEGFFPTPSLFASGRLLNFAIQHWSDSEVFPTSAALSLYENAENLPEALVADRRDYFSFLDFDKFASDAPHFRAQFRAHAKLLDDQLSGEHAFVLSDIPEWADINAYFNIWTGHGNIPSSSHMLDDLDNLNSWYETMLDFGEGQRKEIGADQALAIAKNTEPVSPLHSNRADESGFSLGTFVTVSPTDHGQVPVAGHLCALTDNRISVLWNNDTVGEIAVHFPRIGFQIESGE